MPSTPIQELADPRLADYRNLKDATLAARRGRFVVEGPGNLSILLGGSRFRPESILLSEKAWARSGQEIESMRPDCPIYVVTSDVLDGVVGFPMHRGYLALCPRPAESAAGDPDAFVALAAAALAEDPQSRIILAEGVGNHDNMGGLFRNARAFGARAVLLCPRSCDPLYRKAVRTSMGGALHVPFARAVSWPAPLRSLQGLGYRLIALGPGEALSLDSPDLPRDGPLALLLGSEGPGLSDEGLAAADFRVRIEMAPGVDSINVAVAAGIALHALQTSSGAEKIAP